MMLIWLYGLAAAKSTSSFGFITLNLSICTKGNTENVIRFRIEFRYRREIWEIQSPSRC